MAVHLSPTERAQYDDNVQPQNLAGISICLVITVAALALRMYAQWLVGTLRTADNILGLVAFLFVLTMIVANILAVNGGGGLHIWRVFIEDPDPPQRLVLFFKATWIVSTLSGASYLFIKLSFLLFFIRIFTLLNRTLNIYIYAILIYTTALSIGATIEFIIQCLPVDYFWNRAYLVYAQATRTSLPFPISGSCMPQNLHTAIPIVALLINDIAILGLPIVGLWNLHLSRLKKIGVFFSFALGVFVIVIDIVRLVELFQVDNTGDITWFTLPSLTWSTVESAAAFVCTSIPMMTPLLKYDVRHPGRSRDTYVMNETSDQRTLRRTQEEAASEVTRFGSKRGSGDDDEFLVAAPKEATDGV